MCCGRQFDYIPKAGRFACLLYGYPEEIKLKLKKQKGFKYLQIGQE
jgi:hypothetical protein